LTPDVRRLYCWRWCDACAPDVLLEVLIEQGKIVGVRRADGNYSGFPRGECIFDIDGDFETTHGAGAAAPRVIFYSLGSAA